MKNALDLTNEMGFKDFKDLVNSSVQNLCKTCTGMNPDKIRDTELNAERIKRIEKEVILEEQLINELKNLDRNWKWIILAEPWCGDTAQNLPVISKIADLSEHIDLKIILRDENPELMEQFLTNGSRSIPKLICFDALTQEEIGHWGPRPEGIQEKIFELKRNHPTISSEEFIKQLHCWYTEDNGKSLQKDLLKKIKQWFAKQKE